AETRGLISRAVSIGGPGLWVVGTRGGEPAFGFMAPGGRSGIGVRNGAGATSILRPLSLPAAIVDEWPASAVREPLDAAAISRIPVTGAISAETKQKKTAVARAARKTNR